MGKSTVSSIMDKIKRRSDYNISGDTDLDALIVDAINDGLKMMKQSFYDYGLYENISHQATFKTDYKQAWTDITNAKVVGNIASFTATAGDIITVNIDGAGATSVTLTGATTIYGVEALINAALSDTVASTVFESGEGTITITGTTVVVGTGTHFLTDLAVGEAIYITTTGETKVIATITDDTHMTIAAATNVSDSQYTFSGDNVLVITSPTSASTSSVTVAQTAGSPLARLFNSSADWSRAQ